MALLDRAGLFDRFVAHVGSFTDLSGLSSPTSNATQVDPLVSGTSYAHLLDGGAASKSISIPIAPLDSYESVSMEFYLYFDAATTKTLASIGGQPFIWYSNTGYLKFDLPYLVTKYVRIDYQPEATTQISINLSRDSYSIFIDGIQRSSGGWPGSEFRSDTSITMTSPGSTSVLALGAFILTPGESDLPSIQARALEAFFYTPDAATMYGFTQFEPSDINQDFSAKMDVPEVFSWSEFVSPGVVAREGQMQLDLFYPEKYDSGLNVYTIDDISRYCKSTSAVVHVRIPSYTSSASARGVIRLRRLEPGYDQFEVRLTSGNRLEFLHTKFSVDSAGIDNSTVVTTLLATPATAIPAASVVKIGIGWNDTGLYVVYGTTAWKVPDVYSFSPYGYQAMFGNGRTTVSSDFTAPAFASQSAWTWQVKLINDFNHLAPDVSSTSYGVHTFDSALALTEQMPVYAESSFDVSVPLTADERVRIPYAYIEGAPYQTVGVSEVVE